MYYLFGVNEDGWYGALDLSTVWRGCVGGVESGAWYGSSPHFSTQAGVTKDGWNTLNTVGRESVDGVDTCWVWHGCLPHFQLSSVGDRGQLVRCPQPQLGKTCSTWEVWQKCGMVWKQPTLVQLPPTTQHKAGAQRACSDTLPTCLKL